MDDWSETPSKGTVRAPVAEIHAAELARLAAADDRPRPPGWRLSPRAVALFLLGGAVEEMTVPPKYLGPRAPIETAIATLATDRALLLVGPPGVAKSWVAEHLAAAICGDGDRVVQGTAGAEEAQLRYGWNYAKLVADGPSRDALAPSPVMRAMTEGAIVRIEELSRINPDVQDALISILSEKAMAIPELNETTRAAEGFNLIATANTRDRGVNAMSAALRRRFNTVALGPPESLEEEAEIVARRVAALGAGLGLPGDPPPKAVSARVVALLRALRARPELEGAAASPADAIGAMTAAWAEAAHFGAGALDEGRLAGALAAVLSGGSDGGEAAELLRQALDAVLAEPAHEPDGADAALRAALRARL